jgi:hypothetical protein
MVDTTTPLYFAVVVPTAHDAAGAEGGLLFKPQVTLFAHLCDAAISSVLTMNRSCWSQLSVAIMSRLCFEYLRHSKIA